VRDVGLAEELAQDALVAALEQWPESGVPENPGAWLMATSKHRAIDHRRRLVEIAFLHQHPVDVLGQLLERGKLQHCATLARPARPIPFRRRQADAET